MNGAGESPRRVPRQALSPFQGSPPVDPRPEYSGAIRESMDGNSKNRPPGPHHWNHCENGGSTALDIGAISKFLFNEDSHVDDRTRFDFCFDAASIGRGDEKRKLKLANCVLVELEDTGPHKCCAFLGLLEQRKTSKGCGPYLTALRTMTCGAIPSTPSGSIFSTFHHRRRKVPGFRCGPRRLV